VGNAGLFEKPGYRAGEENHPADQGGYQDEGGGGRRVALNVSRAT
jgi:hypothetical protein